MAHQCKVRHIIEIKDKEGIVQSEESIEEVFEWCIHTTYVPNNGIIIQYLDENWEKQIRVFNDKQVLSIHSR